MTNDLKKLMASFEAHNSSSIRPLPPITAPPPPDGESFKFNSEPEPVEMVTIAPPGVKKKKPLPAMVPSGHSNEKYAFYINDTIPASANSRIAEPLFELTKRDAHRAQQRVHRQIIHNDINPLARSTGNDECDEIARVLELTKNENRLFHQNANILKLIHQGYEDYVNFLKSNETQKQTDLESTDDDVINASASLRAMEDETLATLDMLENLDTTRKVEPEVKTITIDVDPQYNQLTTDYIRLAHEIQRQIDKSEELSNELATMSNWNLKLEENLILEEKELDSELNRANRTIDEHFSAEELAEIFNKM